MRVSAHRKVTERGLERAQRLRQDMSEKEVMLWSRLREFRKTGWAFRRQAQIGTYTADFLCRKAMLVVEVDGWHHDLPDRIKRDLRRDDWMSSKGYQVLRFGAGEIRKQIDIVLDTIEGALRAAS